MIQIMRGNHRGPGGNRVGSILVLAAAMLIVVFAMAAFAIDLGYMSLTKTQLRNAADGAALAAAIELTDGLGTAPAKSTSEVTASANTAARSVAAMQRNGNVSSTLLVPTRDTRYGQLSWNDQSNKWVKSWNTAPYNLVQVTLHRDQPSGLQPGRTFRCRGEFGPSSRDRPPRP